MTDDFLEMRGVSKAFAGAPALTGVDFSVALGEAHALVGENGAGKSTLIKVLMGAYACDAGTISVGGAAVEISSPIEAQRLGLAAVYQDVMLARHLSVAENFFLGRLPAKAGGLWVDWRAIRAETQSFLHELGVDVDVRTRVGALPVARAQLVAIAKAAWTGARLMVFDEPTALLSNAETEMLFRLIRRLRSDGKAIVYISHRMEEIFGLCDRATVLRDGRLVRTLPVNQTSPEGLVTLMVGRELAPAKPRPPASRGEPALALKALSGRGFSDVSFEVARGGIFGLYGLVGAGRTEVLRAVFGAEPPTSGEIRINGEAVAPRSPKQMIARGLGLICEDRKHQSLAMPLTVADNINMIVGGRNVAGWLNRREERARANEYVKRLGVRTPSIRQIVKRLSGGNQQKVVVAKWLAQAPEIFLVDEPTIGVDVASRADIYELLRSLADGGRAILVVSSYMPELLELCDEIAVMRNGRLMGALPRSEASEERLLALASGVAYSEAVKQGASQ